MPGGPCSRTPRGTRAPSRANFSGLRRNSTTSSQLCAGVLDAGDVVPADRAGRVRLDLLRLGARHPAHHQHEHGDQRDHEEDRDDRQPVLHGGVEAGDQHARELIPGAGVTRRGEGCLSGHFDRPPAAASPPSSRAQSRGRSAVANSRSRTSMRSSALWISGSVSKRVRTRCGKKP